MSLVCKVNVGVDDNLNVLLHLLLCSANFFFPRGCNQLGSVNTGFVRGWNVFMQATPLTWFLIVNLVFNIMFASVWISLEYLTSCLLLQAYPF